MRKLSVWKNLGLVAAAAGIWAVVAFSQTPEKKDGLAQTIRTAKVTAGPIERTVVVRGLGERRGTATAAAALYEETAESEAQRREREAQLKLMPETSFRGKGRPTKRQRRELDRLRDPWPE